MELEAYNGNVKPDFNILQVDKHYESFQIALAVKVCQVVIAALVSYSLLRTFAKLVKATGGGQN